VDTSDVFIKRISPRFAKKLKKPYIHAKMILIDDRYLLIGSMNLSSNSLDNNREHGIITTDSKTIQQFKQQFDKDRAVANKK
jgi:phosphatidylserine/phosphatidylglycerophosphate/cardiolipin synthase-like enzyme